jgi:hypothetical protein
MRNCAHINNIDGKFASEYASTRNAVWALAGYSKKIGDLKDLAHAFCKLNIDKYERKNKLRIDDWWNTCDGRIPIGVILHRV